VIGDDSRVWQFDVLRKLWAEYGGIGITIEELT
jgi:Holliday junction resolvase RusA-like endonuclease